MLYAKRDAVIRDERGWKDEFDSRAGYLGHIGAMWNVCSLCAIYVQALYRDLLAHLGERQSVQGIVDVCGGNVGTADYIEDGGQKQFGSRRRDLLRNRDRVRLEHLCGGFDGFAFEGGVVRLRHALPRDYQVRRDFEVGHYGSRAHVGFL